jgi:hypothetical protein
MIRLITNNKNQTTISYLRNVVAIPRQTKRQLIDGFGKLGNKLVGDRFMHENQFLKIGNQIERSLIVACCAMNFTIAVQRCPQNESDPLTHSDTATSISAEGLL